MQTPLAVATLGAVLALTTSGTSLAQTPTPSAAPAASPTALQPRMPQRSVTASPAPRIHRAIATCDPAPFWSWPSRDTAPSPASYPPARVGDSFEVIGDAHVSFNGMVLYETTIDVVHPWGDGVHYWIAERCVNAA